jgi:hypothetical protein
MMKVKHEGLLAQFSAKFEPQVLDKWLGMIEAWDIDSTRPNPYEEPAKGIWD